MADDLTAPLDWPPPAELLPEEPPPLAGVEVEVELLLLLPPPTEGTPAAGADGV